MPTIINLPKFDAIKFVPQGPWDLIRISDPAQGFATIDPKIAKRYNSIHEFEFLDANEFFEEGFLFQPEQATDIINILVNALDNDRNVLVHCNMGLCRSGAVAEVGVVMGFTDSGRYRQPNTLVKKLLLNEAISRGLL